MKEGYGNFLINSYFYTHESSISVLFKFLWIDMKIPHDGEVDLSPYDELKHANNCTTETTPTHL